MKIYLWIFGLCFLLSVVVTGQHENYAEIIVKKTLPQSPLTLDGPFTAARKESAEPHLGSAGWNLAYLVFGWPNGVTVWALFLTLIAIAEQTAETRNSVHVSRESMELAIAPLRPWLEIDGWKSEIITLHEMPAIRVRVEIRNGTDYPITLSRGVIQFAYPDWGVRCELGEGTFLPPKYPKAVEVSFNIGDLKMHQYEMGGFAIGVRGELQFQGVIRGEVTQKFLGLLFCSKNGTVFEAEIPMGPSPAAMVDDI